MSYLKWLLTDRENDKSAGGCYADAGVTMTQLNTFANVLVGYSDAVVAKLEVHEIDDKAVVLPTTGNVIEHTGLITIQNRTNQAEKYQIAIPALKTTAIDPNGTGTHKILPAVESAVLAAWASMNAYTVTDYRVSRSVVYYRRR